jgi:sortase family protein
MRAVPPAPVTDAEPGRHARYSRPWRQVARRPLTAAVLLGGVLAMTITVIGLLVLTGRPGHPPGPASAAPDGLTPLGTPAPLPKPTTVTAPPPVALRIPAIGVRTRLTRLGLTRRGTLQVPASPSVAGWYARSPRPGEIGSSVIAGHIDSYLGPGVFYRLRDLHRGNRIYVRQADGRLAVFRVTGVHQYPKARFPTAAVYGPVPDAELHLITCGGTFDYATHSYLSNVVVNSTEAR